MFYKTLQIRCFREMRTRELDLFDMCKSNDSENEADAGLLLRVCRHCFFISNGSSQRLVLFQLLKNCGILRTDPRLSPVMCKLERIRKSQAKSKIILPGVDNMLLDFSQFVE